MPLDVSALCHSRGLERANTYTAHDNHPLHRQMRRHGYEIALKRDEMIVFRKLL